VTGDLESAFFGWFLMFVGPPKFKRKKMTKPLSNCGICHTVECSRSSSSKMHQCLQQLNTHYYYYLTNDYCYYRFRRCVPRMMASLSSWWSSWRPIPPVVSSTVTHRYKSSTVYLLVTRLTGENDDPIWWKRRQTLLTNAIASPNLRHVPPTESRIS